MHREVCAALVGELTKNMFPAYNNENLILSDETKGAFDKNISLPVTGMYTVAFSGSTGYSWGHLMINNVIIAQFRAATASEQHGSFITIPFFAKEGDIAKIVGNSGMTITVKKIV